MTDRHSTCRRAGNMRASSANAETGRLLQHGAVEKLWFQVTATRRERRWPSLI